MPMINRDDTNMQADAAIIAESSNFVKNLANPLYIFSRKIALSFEPLSEKSGVRYSIRFRFRPDSGLSPGHTNFERSSFL